MALRPVRTPGNACLSGVLSGRTGTLAEPCGPNSKGLTAGWSGQGGRSAPFRPIPTLVIRTGRGTKPDLAR